MRLITYAKNTLGWMLTIEFNEKIGRRNIVKEVLFLEVPLTKATPNRVTGFSIHEPINRAMDHCKKSFGSITITGFKRFIPRFPNSPVTDVEKSLHDRYEKNSRRWAIFKDESYSKIDYPKSIADGSESAEKLFPMFIGSEENPQFKTYPMEYVMVKGVWVPKLVYEVIQKYIAEQIVKIEKEELLKDIKEKGIMEGLKAHTQHFPAEEKYAYLNKYTVVNGDNGLNEKIMVNKFKELQKNKFYNSQGTISPYHIVANNKYTKDNTLKGHIPKEELISAVKYDALTEIY